MSAWGPLDWAKALFIAFAFCGGVAGLLRRPAPGAKRWSGERFNSVVLIGWALLMLLDRHSVQEAWAPILMGGLLLLVALWILLAQPALDARQFQKEMRAHEAALSSLAAHASTYSAPSYETELRALETEAPVPPSTGRRHLAAAILALVGGTFLTLGLVGARQ